MSRKGISSVFRSTWPRLILVVSALFILTFCSCATAASRSTDAYQYPVKPGTEEWKALMTHEDMLAVCQIPEPVLKEMSTAGLAESVLNYPLLGEYMAFNSPQQGFDQVASHFNGLSELLDREGAGKELLTRYSAMQPQAITVNSPTRDDYEKVFGINDLELIFEQDSILFNLKDAELRELVQTACEKYLAKQQLIEVYSKSSLEFSARLIGKALQQSTYQPFSQFINQDSWLRNFLATGSFSSDETLDGIMSLAEQFLSRK